MSDGTGESAVVGPVSGAITHRVFAERLSLFFRSLLLSNSVVIANSLLLAYILQTPENRRTVILWAGVSLTVALFRFTTLLRYSRQDFATREDRAGAVARVRFSLAWRCPAPAWGAAGYLLFDLSDVVNQSFLAFVLRRHVRRRDREPLGIFRGGRNLPGAVTVAVFPAPAPGAEFRYRGHGGHGACYTCR
jgi:hypothetical protein